MNFSMLAGDYERAAHAKGQLKGGTMRKKKVRRTKLLKTPQRAGSSYTEPEQAGTSSHLAAGQKYHG